MSSTPFKFGFFFFQLYRWVFRQVHIKTRNHIVKRIRIPNDELNRNSSVDFLNYASGIGIGISGLIYTYAAFTNSLICLARVMVSV